MLLIFVVLKKRKVEIGLKYYVVKVGFVLGVYINYVDC